MGAAQVKFKVLMRNQISDLGIPLTGPKEPEITEAWDLPKNELLKILGAYSQTQDAQVRANVLIAEKTIEILEKFPG
jgi:hypothetical protein